MLRSVAAASNGSVGSDVPIPCVREHRSVGGRKDGGDGGVAGPQCAGDCCKALLIHYR